MQRIRASAALLLLLPPLAIGDDPEDEATSCDLFPQEELDAHPRWVTAEDGVLEFVFDGPPGFVWDVEAVAAIAHLTTRWSQFAVPDESGLVVVRLSIPEAAFLHDSSADYLTGLQVNAYGTDGNHNFRMHAPRAFLAWPDGPTGSPVVWDDPAAEIHAPHGIVSASTRALYGEMADGEMAEAPIGAEVHANPPQEK
jgi:hypothetical protein